MSDRDRPLSEALKKLIQTGLGAAEITEDMAKKILSDLPHAERLTKMMENAKTTKEELIGLVKEAVADQVGQIDFKKVWQGVLEDYEMDVKMKVTFKKKNEDSDDGTSEES